MFVMINASCVQGLHRLRNLGSKSFQMKCSFKLF